MFLPVWPPIVVELVKGGRVMGTLKKLLAAAVLVLGCTACGGADQKAEPDTGGGPPALQASKLAVVATDYSFEGPSTTRGGLVELTYSNRGKEPHFAALVKATGGATFPEVKAALMAARGGPAGPPPFERFGGAPTADPGATPTRMMFNLPAGTYALFCAIPSPDGMPHIAKGMIREITVSEGPPGELEESVGTVSATDFSFTDVPELAPGKSVLKLRNEGNQLHEINLIELRADATVGEAAAWLTRPSGPPPHRSLSGVAVKPGEEATVEFDLAPGNQYTFVCIIPDLRGDLAPHVAKGMSTPAFAV